MKKLAKRKLENLYQNKYMHLFMLDTPSEMANSNVLFSDFKEIFEQKAENSNTKNNQANKAQYSSISSKTSIISINNTNSKKQSNIINQTLKNSSIGK